MSEKMSKDIAMKNLGMALKSVAEEEKGSLMEFQKQVSLAVKADPNLDKQLEFCYAIIFSPDKIKNETIIKAARHYIEACEA